ncbi:UDP-N-acetylglucosamine 2-epimerase (non-hydrolyzing) [Candidatus Woesearchaeota archaeon]|nr:UDP-N-acetylglucosamine 2-epimerase (non-hydrolyzing) [Candidatus Woesearchaeota archaeon]
MVKIAIILGTRPEIIKMSPVIRECIRRKTDFFILHSGQHYSYRMDAKFFEDLELPSPRYNLNVGSSSHAAQTSDILAKTERILLKEKPDVVLVQGDTNTVLAGALAAAKLHIPVGHIEAGLRSGDKNMPEEINRIMADHCSDFLFAPTVETKKNLKKENITSKIIVTGNTIVDAVQQSLKISKKKSKIMGALRLKKNRFMLLTLHRQENVDNKARLKQILSGIQKIHDQFNLLIIYPIHPRTKKRIQQFKLKMPKGVKQIRPIGFLDFLQLESNAALLLTDSGGVQEEGCILKVPCVTIRDSTERPETVQVKANTIAGHNPKNILKSAEKMFSVKRIWKNPFGKGDAGKRILNSF